MSSQRVMWLLCCSSSSLQSVHHPQSSLTARCSAHWETWLSRQSGGGGMETSNDYWYWSKNIWQQSLIWHSSLCRFLSQRASVFMLGIQSLWHSQSGRLPTLVTWQWMRWSQLPMTCSAQGATVFSAIPLILLHSTVMRSQSGQAVMRMS